VAKWEQVSSAEKSPQQDACPFLALLFDKSNFPSYLAGLWGELPLWLGGARLGFAEEHSGLGRIFGLAHRHVLNPPRHELEEQSKT
jgi:hypothetical protein